MPPPPTFEARLVATRALTPSVRELVFDRSDGAPFRFEAGQWISLILPHAEKKEGGDLRRSYSIASEPNGTARFELAITLVANGPGSSLLHALEPGATVTAIGPQGFFTRPLAKAPPSLFVATGTGVTPFRSMMLAAAAADDATPMWLLFGVRHERDLIYRDELAALVAGRPHIRVEYTLSQPGPGWNGRSGYVQKHVRELLDAQAALPASAERAPHVYICGLEKMVGSVRELLRKDLGLPRERVHSERYD